MIDFASTPAPVPASPRYTSSTREAARLLGYESLDTFYDHLRLGYIAGAERRGRGPRPRWWFNLAELAYVGPVTRPVNHAECQQAERRARIEATSADDWESPYSRRARSRAAN